MAEEPTISKDTKVTVAVVLVICGGIWWAATQDARSRTNNELLDVLVPKVEVMQQDISAIKAVVAPDFSVNAGKR